MIYASDFVGPQKRTLPRGAGEFFFFRGSLTSIFQKFEEYGGERNADNAGNAVIAEKKSEARW
jgi:hypothetical protein